MKFVAQFLILSWVAFGMANHASAQSNAYAAVPSANMAQAHAQPIRIGLIFPLTGGSSDMGNSARIGAQVAVNEINAVGGYLGRKLELVIRDDAADPDTGLKHAEDLVLKEKVVATLGFCNTGVAMKALDVFQKNKQILIVTCATGTPITAKYPPAESFVFRTSARDGLQTQFLVDEVVKRGLKKVAILADTTGYGDAGLKDLEAALGKAGLKAQAVVRFKIGVKTLSEEIRQLRDSGADVLIGWTVAPEEGVIAASRQAVGWKVPQFGPWGLSNASAFETSHGAVANTLSVQTVLPNPNMDRNSTFLHGYSKLSKEELMGSMMSASQTYDGMHLLLRGIFESKGDLSGPGLKAALENLPHIYRGVVTSYDHPFSISDHDAISSNMLWLGTWRGGERTYAYAEDASRATIIRRKQH
jgi:branched-chain amino acid transport system substrate-binding protein